jgi:hypothetical protein
MPATWLAPKTPSKAMGEGWPPMAATVPISNPMIVAW